MIYSNVYKLKEGVNKLAEAVCIGLDKAGQAGDFETSTRSEAAMFFLYLALSEGVLNMDEVDEIGKICGIGIGDHNLREFLDTGKIEDADYVDKPPYTFQIMVEIDKLLYGMGLDLECAKSALDVYRMFAEESVKAGGHRAVRKMRAVQYLGTMEKYMQEELDGKAPGKQVSQSIRVVKPSKEGLPAPWKSQGFNNR